MLHLSPPTATPPKIELRTEGNVGGDGGWGSAKFRTCPRESTFLQRRPFKRFPGLFPSTRPVAMCSSHPPCEGRKPGVLPSPFPHRGPRRACRHSRILPLSPSLSTLPLLVGPGPQMSSQTVHMGMGRKAEGKGQGVAWAQLNKEGAKAEGSQPALSHLHPPRREENQVPREPPS